MAQFKRGKKTRYYKKSASSVPPPKVSIGPDKAFCAYKTLGGSTPHLHPAPPGRFPRTDRRRTRQAPLGAPVI